MFRSFSGRVLGALVVSLLVFGFSLPVGAQVLHSVVQPSGRVFSSVGPGVAAIKRDSQGRYYILARPATHISIYSPDGRLITQIPDSGASPSIVYAMDFDIDSNGSLYIADRGANAVLVFRPDGSFAARVPVFAPTSVVALPNHQFAVASFHGRRLVQIFDDRGLPVRSFGDPADSGAPAPADDASHHKESPVYLGRIFGGATGQIYFAFTTMPDPTFRTYDRYGYVAYEASVPESDLVSYSDNRFDRFEFSFNFSRFDLSDQVIGSTTIGSSGDVRVGGGVGTGIGAGLNRPGGGGFGGGGFGGRGGGFGGGFGGPSGGGSQGLLAAQANITPDSFHVTLGSNPASSDRNGRLPGGGSSDSNSSPDLQGSVLQFAGANSSFGSANSSRDDVDFSQLESTDILNSSSASSSSSDLSGAGANPSIPGDLAFGDGPGAPGGVFTQHFLYGRLFGGGFGGLGGPGDFGGPHNFAADHPEGHAASAGSSSSEPFPHYGPHGRFGGGMTSMSGGVRINLDTPVRDPNDKPEFSALAVDPETQEVWAAIGDSLVHFDKSGNPLAVFALVTSGNVPLRPSAILVERDRLLVAADPFGIFEFARPDAYLHPALRASSPSSPPGASSQP